MTVIPPGIFGIHMASAWEVIEYGVHAIKETPLSG